MAAETAVLHAAEGAGADGPIPREWMDQVTKGVECVTLARQLVMMTVQAEQQTSKL